MNQDSLKWRCRYRVDKYDGDIDRYRLKYGNVYGERYFKQSLEPYETIRGEGNLAMTAGVQAIWAALTSGTAGAFTAANAAIGVGDNVGPGTISISSGSTTVTGSGTSFTTDLYPGQVINAGLVQLTVASIQSATSLTVVTAPTVTASSQTYGANPFAAQTNLLAAINSTRVGMVSGFPAQTSNEVQFQAAFGSASANYAWVEWGVFSSIGTGSPPSGGVMLNRAVPASYFGVKAGGTTWNFTVAISLS